MLKDAIVIDKAGNRVDYVQVVFDPVIIECDSKKQNMEAIAACGVDEKELEFAMDLLYNEMDDDLLLEKYGEKCLKEKQEILTKCSDFSPIKEFEETNQYHPPRILNYELKEGESLVFEGSEQALRMHKAYYDGNKWTDSEPKDVEASLSAPEMQEMPIDRFTQIENMIEALFSAQTTAAQARARARLEELKGK